MINSVFPIELDGNLWQIPESEGDRAYISRGEPLRPANAVTVQGEEGQKFQARLDTLLWSWTDWSGGEGRRVWKLGETDRSWRLTGVRAFDRPGTLSPGYFVTEAKGTDGSTPLGLSVAFAKAADYLVAFDLDNPAVYYWSNSSKYFTLSGSFTGPTNGCAGPFAADGDGDTAWFEESGTYKIWPFFGGTSLTALTTITEFSATNNHHLVQLGDYIYVYSPGDAKVLEIDKSTGSRTTIDAWTEKAEDGGLVAMDGKLFVMHTGHEGTAIRQITPTSAAGTGFGAEIVRISGFKAEAFWYHTGTLYILGTYQDGGEERTVLYHTPKAVDSQYGTLGQVRDGENMETGTGGASRMLDHFWVQEDVDNTLGTERTGFMQVDAVSGGIACLAYDRDGNIANGEAFGSIASWGGDILVSTVGATDDGVLVARRSLYAEYGEAVSPLHDFDFVGEKYLGSMSLACEPLPADWTVYVDYMVDNDGTWNNAIQYSTTSGTGTDATITTDLNTVTFRNLQMRIRFQYTGLGGPDNEGPVILGVEARAAVVEKVRVWQLLLDLNDPQSAGSQARGGYTRLQKFLATAVKDDAVAFKDGYISPDPGVFDEYDVTVDSWDVDLSRPGEGVGIITLREVV